MAIGDQLLINSGQPDLAPWGVSGSPVLTETANPTPGGDNYWLIQVTGGDNVNQSVGGLAPSGQYQVQHKIRKTGSGFSRLDSFWDDGNGANGTSGSVRVEVSNGATSLASGYDDFGVADGGDHWIVWANITLAATNTRILLRPNRVESNSTAEVGDFMVTEWDGTLSNAVYVRDPAPPSQYLRKTEELDFVSQGAWDERDGATSLFDSVSSATGSNYYRVETVTSPNSFLNQDLTDAAFDGVRMNVQAVVSAGTNNNARLGVWLLGGGNNQYNVIDIDTNDGSISMVEGSATVESDLTTPSTFSVDLGGGEWFVSFSFVTPSGVDRILTTLHRGLQGTNALYTRVNLTLNPDDGFPAYQFVDTGVSLPPPSKMATRITSLNPAVDPDYAVFNTTREEHTYDSTVLVATAAEFQTAAQNAVSSQNTLILWTVNSISDNINATLTQDFIGDGGVLVIDTQNGEPLITTGVNRINGGKGYLWQNFGGRAEFDNYEARYNTETLYANFWVNGGNSVWRNGSCGTGFIEGQDPLFTALGMYSTSDDTDNTILYDNVDTRGCMSSYRSRGAMRRMWLNCYDAGELEDSVYQNNNTGADTGEPNKKYMVGFTQGPPQNNNLQFLLVNTRNEPWIGSDGFFPYAESQIVQQDNGADGIFEAEITRIHLGDGNPYTTWFTNARNIDNDGLGWYGDVVYMIPTENCQTYLHSGAEITSPTVPSGSAYVPSAPIETGAATNFDCGVWFGLVHTDFHQDGADNDDATTVYNTFAYGLVSVSDSPAGGEVQGQIFNNATNGYENYWQNCYISQTATRAQYCNEGETVGRSCIHVRASLGSEYEVNLSNPSVSFNPAVLPQVTISTPTTWDNVPIFEDTISGVNTVQQSVIDDGMPFPYLGEITQVSPSSTSGANDYSSVFNYTFDRYQAGQVPAAFVDQVKYPVTIIPWNATKEQAKRLTQNTFARHFEPQAGWDYTTDNSGSGYTFPGLIGSDWLGARVGAIRFTDYWVQEVEQGGAVVVPAYTATDGVADLTGSVVVTNTVDTNTLGYQYIQYDLTDPQGNDFTTYSIVNVVSGDAPPPSANRFFTTGGLGLGIGLGFDSFSSFFGVGGDHVESFSDEFTEEF